jgi:hypothetical protein
MAQLYFFSYPGIYDVYQQVLATVRRMAVINDIFIFG